MRLPFCCHTKTLPEFLLPKQTWNYPTLNRSVVTPPIPSDTLVNGAIDHPTTFAYSYRFVRSRPLDSAILAASYGLMECHTAGCPTS